jgi:hypothetical protein
MVLSARHELLKLCTKMSCVDATYRPSSHFTVYLQEEARS